MMGIINGIERTPAQFEALVEEAGMRLEKIWECRSQVSIVEVRLRGGVGAEGGEGASGVNGVNGENGVNGHHD